MKLEEEIQIRRQPNVFTYHYSDKKVKTKIPEFSIPRAKREKTPSPDRKKALNANYSYIKNRSYSLRFN